MWEPTGREGEKEFKNMWDQGSTLGNCLDFWCARDRLITGEDSLMPVLEEDLAEIDENIDSVLEVVGGSTSSRNGRSTTSRSTMSSTTGTRTTKSIMRTKRENKASGTSSTTTNTGSSSDSVFGFLKSVAGILARSDSGDGSYLPVRTANTIVGRKQNDLGFDFDLDQEEMAKSV